MIRAFLTGRAWLTSADCRFFADLPPLLQKVLKIHTKTLTILAVNGKINQHLERGVNFFMFGRCIMAAKGNRVKITLACTECKQRNYDTFKNKKNDTERLEMSKYCKFCKKHTAHKEAK